MVEFHDNSQAFAFYWVKAQPVVSGLICGAIPNRHDAEDVLQEVAVTAAKDFNQYDQARPFLPWVLTIARHRIADHHRKNMRDKVTFDADTLETLSDAAHRLTNKVSDREAALSECMEQLPGRGRRILEMRYHFDMSADTIGRRLGATPKAVFSALHRLRVALGKCIDKRLNSGTAQEGGA